MAMKKGFSVGPDNLPDGIHRRKVQKIKQNLIRKTKIRKSYDKIRSRESELFGTSRETGDESASAEHAAPAGSLDLHPERQAMLEDERFLNVPREEQKMELRKVQRPLRPSRAPLFKKEAELAKQRKDERIARQHAIEEANRDRELKRKEKENFRKAMLKAKNGGRFGNERRLGRESKALLEKVQKMVQK